MDYSTSLQNHSHGDTPQFAHNNVSTIPVSVDVNVTPTQGIPPLNHDPAMKWAKIQFTGLGDIFVFYNQLMNGMEQFGIFLVP
jgi:hypothetical protein